MFSTRRVAAAAIALFLGYAAALSVGHSEARFLRNVDDLYSVALALIAVVFAVLAARSNDGRLRAAWTVLATGLVCWVIGEVLWAYREIVEGRTAYVSLADVFYLSFSACAAAALMLFWDRRGAPAQGRILLDGVIVAGSLFAMSWLLGMHRIDLASATDRMQFAVSLAYPISDLVVLTIAALVVISAPAGRRRVLSLLALGLACAAVADTAYAYLTIRGEYTSGDVIDLGWAAALLLIAVAAAAGRTPASVEHAGDELPGWATVWLPYLPLLLAAGVITASPVTLTRSGPVLVVGAVLIIAVLLRQYLVVAQNRRLFAAVADQALRDPLTGLANRTLFTDRLRRAHRGHDSRRTALGVLVVDLDDFKLINDTLGHAAGDDLLRATGQRIVACVGDGDTVARLGGDEFAVVVEAEVPALEAVTHRIVEAFNQPIRVEGHDLLVQPSVGLAVMGAGDPRVPAEELLRRADLAMYAAKRGHTAKARTYTEEMSRAGTAMPARVRGRPAGGVQVVQLFGQLRRAIDERELALVYQPKFDLQTREVVGLEALLRWPHPDRGLLGPDEFLPLVRRYGLTGAVTDLVLSLALDDVGAWRAEGVEVPVAVNLFPPSVVIPDLPARIDEALAARGLTPAALTVEITEDLVLGDIGLARQVLVQLRDRGIRVAIDDFGSGYSALWYLRDLPVDEIKLDRDFIAPIAVDPRGAAVVRAVIDLARLLGIATTAEGVEDAATADVLRRFRCDMVQGFYFSPPLSAAEVRGMARRLGTVGGPAAPVTAGGA